MNEPVDQKILLEAFGRITLRNLQQDDRIKDLEKVNAQLVLDLHHMDIHVQAMSDEHFIVKERLRVLMEKAPTVIVPVVPAPEPPAVIPEPGIIYPFQVE